MLSLLNKNEKRQFEIIRLLSNSNRGFSVEEITSQLKISERTLYRDIKAINENYESLEIASNDLMTISYKDGNSIKNVCQEIISRQGIFKIIEILLYRDDLNITHLASMLDSSAPTLYRDISNFNKLIKEKYDFQIMTSPCMLSGNEAHIRAFLNHYFEEAYDPYSWPFENIDENEVEAFLSLFENFIGSGFDYAIHQNTKRIIALNLIFNSRGRFIDGIEKDPTLVNSLNRILETLKDKQELADSIRGLGINLEVDSLLQVLYPFATENFVAAYPTALIRDILPKELLRRGLLIEAFVDHLGEYADIKPDARAALAVRIFNALGLGLFSPYSDYILNENGLKFYNSIAYMFPDMERQVSHGLEDIYKDFKLDYGPVFHRHMVNIVFMNWPGIMSQLLCTENNGRALIISDLGSGHADMYRFRFQAEFSNLSMVDIYDRPSLDVAWINKSPFELIISNCPISGLDPKKNHIIVSTCPNLSDFDKVRKATAGLVSKQNLCTMVEK